MTAAQEAVVDAMSNPKGKRREVENESGWELLFQELFPNCCSVPSPCNIPPASNLHQAFGKLLCSDYDFYRHSCNVQQWATSEPHSFFRQQPTEDSITPTTAVGLHTFQTEIANLGFRESRHAIHGHLQPILGPGTLPKEYATRFPLFAANS